MAVNKYVKLDEWAKELIVDPLGKERLVNDQDGNYLIASYGRKWPIVDGVYDLRLLDNTTTEDQRKWTEGQTHYELRSRESASRDCEQDYEAEIASVADVYREIPIVGSCLDIGGNQGRLRHFLSPDQPYICCDPFLDVFDGIERRYCLINSYPFLLEPVNFVCCYAEHLPFCSSAFDVVHMRSVIDHFRDPEVALYEAYRVLRLDGYLVVGSYVYGGKSGKPGGTRRAKDAIKHLITYLGVKRYHDHHVWHPTLANLSSLVESSGFRITKVHWQKGFGDTVCYLRGQKVV